MEQAVESTPVMDSVTRLSRDLKKAASSLTVSEARFLTDGYYMLQEYRKASGNQINALSKSGEPHEVLQWLFAQAETLEGQIKRALDTWSDQTELGRWCKSQVGIGPVLAAGLLANIDLERAPTAGHILSFAGIAPNIKWEKGQKRPWNGRLKTLCWLIGDSFVKQSGRENCVYGKLYFQRKEYEQRKNMAGDYADQARAKLTEVKFKQDAEAVLWYTGAFDPRIMLFVQESGIAWKQGMAKKLTIAAIQKKLVDKYIEEQTNDDGMPLNPDAKKTDPTLQPVYNYARSLGELKGVEMLPPARIHLRCLRWTVKIFLEHYYGVGRTCLGLPVAIPYVLAILGHNDRIPIPNFDMSRITGQK